MQDTQSVTIFTKMKSLCTTSASYVQFNFLYLGENNYIAYLLLNVSFLFKCIAH